MLRRTLVALTATVALGCLPIATNAFAAGHSHGGGHVGGTAAGRGGHAHYARGGGHRHFAGRGYGGYGGGGYGYPGYGYGPAYGYGYPGYGYGYGPAGVVGGVIGGLLGGF